MTKYEVAIVYRAQVNFVIEAASAAEAEMMARSRWENGEDGDPLGNESATVERIVSEPVA